MSKPIRLDRVDRIYGWRGGQYILEQLFLNQPTEGTGVGLLQMFLLLYVLI